MTKTCVICEEPFTPQFNSTQRTCDAPCAIIFARRKSLRQRDKARQAISKRARDFKANTIAHQHKLTRTVFNRLRILQELKRFKDLGIEPSCISCGGVRKDWCCGHFKTVGARGDLRYDPRNTNLQCNFHCNCSKSGNIPGYIEGLCDRLGPNGYAALEEYLEVRQDHEWTVDSLKAFRAECSKATRELDKENG